MFVRLLLMLLLFAFGLYAAAPVQANDPVSQNNYALELLDKGEYEKALDLLQRAYSLYPYNETIRRNLAAAYVYVAQKEMSHNKYSEAAEYFDLARELIPDNASYSMMRGVALFLAKNYDGSKREFERAISVSGENVDVLFYLGRISYDTGDLILALQYWEKALALDAGNKIIREYAAKVRRELTVEGRMDKGQSSRFEISYDAEFTPGLAAEILDALEGAYNLVGADLNHFPSARVPVILYTKKDYRLVTAGPDWSGGMYDGKIRLPIGGMQELTPQLRGVLIHEYTHVVVYELTRGNVPTWLNEGLAEYEGRKYFNPPMASLGRKAKQGTYLSVPSLEGPFTSLGNNEALLAYQQSYSMVNFMIATYGWFNVKEILLNLGKKMSIEMAIKNALSGFGLDYAAMVQEWQVYMKNEFGGNTP